MKKMELMLYNNWGKYAKIIPNKFSQEVTNMDSGIIKRHIDTAGINFIGKWEGYKSKPYLCPANKWTIGMGHVILEGEVFPVDGISVEIAKHILKEDIARRSGWINNNIKVQLTQGQYNALVSVAFNSTSNGNLSNIAPKAIHYLNDKEYAKSAYELFSKECGLVNITIKSLTTGKMEKKICAGLVNRRASELEMWNGTYAV